MTSDGKAQVSFQSGYDITPIARGAVLLLQIEILDEVLDGLDDGIVDYCGSTRGVTSFIYESEQPDEAATLARVDQAASAIADRIKFGQRAEQLER